MELTVEFSGRFNRTQQIYHRNIPLKYNRFQQMSCPLSGLLLSRWSVTLCWSLSLIKSRADRVSYRSCFGWKLGDPEILSLKKGYIIGLPLIKKWLYWFTVVYQFISCVSSRWSYKNSIDNFGGLCPISIPRPQTSPGTPSSSEWPCWVVPLRSHGNQMAGGYFGALNKLGDCIASIIAIPWRKFRTYTIVYTYIYILSIICITCITE